MIQINNEEQTISRNEIKAWIVNLETYWLLYRERFPLYSRAKCYNIASIQCAQNEFRKNVLLCKLVDEITPFNNTAKLLKTLQITVAYVDCRNHNKNHIRDLTWLYPQVYYWLIVDSQNTNGIVQPAIRTELFFVHGCFLSKRDLYVFCEFAGSLKLSQVGYDLL